LLGDGVSLVANDGTGPPDEVIADILMPRTIDLDDHDEVAVGDPVSGTGTPGADIRVVNGSNGEVLCETTVEPDGTWECDIDEDATPGPANVVVQELTDDTDPDPENWVWES